MDAYHTNMENMEGLHRGFNVNSYDYQHQSLHNRYSRDNEGRFGYDDHQHIHSLQNNSPRDFIQMRGVSTLQITLMLLHTIIGEEQITLKGVMQVADITLDMIIGIRESDIMLLLTLFHRVFNKIVLCIITMIGSIQALIFLAKIQEIKFSQMRLPLLIYKLQSY